MSISLELAIHLCAQAEQSLANVDIPSAIGTAMRAKHLVGSYADPQAGSVYVRAAMTEADAHALADDLLHAEAVAATALLWAQWCDVAQDMLVRVHIRLLEIREMRHQYIATARDFVRLEQHLPDEPWAAALKMHCANHMLSIGVHNADPLLAEHGIACGARIRSMVPDPDEVAAWLQWRAIHESRRARSEAAQRTFEESFTLRATTPRRNLTKAFLDTEMAFFESDADGVTALSKAVAAAQAAGLHRHARAATDHMRRFFA